MAAFVDEFDSERVHFMGINETDAPEIVEWRSDSGVYRFFRAAHRITLDEHLSWYRNNYLTNESRYDWMQISSSGLPSDDVHSPALGDLDSQKFNNGFGSSSMASFFTPAAKSRMICSGRLKEDSSALMREAGITTGSGS